MSITTQGAALARSISPHPFDPLTPQEIRLGFRILQSAFPGVQIRINRIDLQEPIKKDVIPYIEAERLRKPLPPKPARLLYAYFHRLDTGACCKALLNADNASVVYAKELPAGVQVSHPNTLMLGCLS
jgi:primary-amine oxidase